MEKNKFAEIALDKLKKYNDFYTINLTDDRQFRKLDSNESEKFLLSISVLLKSFEKRDSKVQVVFRAFKHSYLKEIYSFEDVDRKINKLLSYLFYFGDKAKNYYKNSTTKNKRWLEDINDLSDETLERLFLEVQARLDKRGFIIDNFKKSNKEFVDYFLDGDNKNKFVIEISKSLKARNYYMYFLHTHNDEFNESYLVSTSLSEEKAMSFAKEDSSYSYMVYYVIPSPIENYSISHELLKLDEEIKSISSDLPTYNGESLHPDEKEYAVVGALFRNHILAIKVIDNNVDHEKIIVNPFLLLNNNDPEDIIDGLNINEDEECFSKNLGSEEVNFSCGIFSSKNGEKLRKIERT